MMINHSISNEDIPPPLLTPQKPESLNRVIVEGPSPVRTMTPTPASQDGISGNQGGTPILPLVKREGSYSQSAATHSQPGTTDLREVGERQMSELESHIFKRHLLGENSLKDLDLQQQREVISQKSQKSLEQVGFQYEDDQGIDYKKERCIIYLANMTLVFKIKELEDSITNIKSKIDLINNMPCLDHHKIEDGSITPGHSSKNKKRKRLKKNEVVRNFKCVIGDCQKAYGSENSLNQHIKNKHTSEWKELKEAQQLDVGQETMGKMGAREVRIAQISNFKN